MPREKIKSVRALELSIKNILVDEVRGDVEVKCVKSGHNLHIIWPDIKNVGRLWSHMIELPGGVMYLLTMNEITPIVEKIKETL